MNLKLDARRVGSQTEFKHCRNNHAKSFEKCSDIINRIIHVINAFCSILLYVRIGKCTLIYDYNMKFYKLNKYQVTSNFRGSFRYFSKKEDQRSQII